MISHCKVLGRFLLTCLNLKTSETDTRSRIPVNSSGGSTRLISVIVLRVGREAVADERGVSHGRSPNLNPPSLSPRFDRMTNYDKPGLILHESPNQTCLTEINKAEREILVFNVKALFSYYYTLTIHLSQILVHQPYVKLI